MKAGGGKAAFRQAELFAFAQDDRVRYESVALAKLLYPHTVEVFSTEPVAFEHTGKARTEFSGRLSELASKYASISQAVPLDHIDESASIDNGKLRLDMYDHRWFQLGLSWTTKHVTYNARSGEYPRRYIEIDLTMVKEGYWPTLKAALDRFMPKAITWSTVSDGVASGSLRESRIPILCDTFELDDEQELMEQVNATSATVTESTGPHYYYRVDAVVVDVPRLLTLPSVCMVVVHGDGRGIVGHPSQQHPLIDLPSPLLVLLPKCRWQDKPCSAAISYA